MRRGYMEGVLEVVTPLGCVERCILQLFRLCGGVSLPMCITVVSMVTIGCP